MRPALAPALGATALLAACNFGVADISTVPANPTFTADVKPLLDDHCNLCHGATPTRDAPENFRLDTYDAEGGRNGARAMARSIVSAVDGDEMPPAAAWGDGMGPNGKKLLKLWVDQGAPR